MSKLIICFVLSIFSMCSLFAQIQGLSASKLATVDAETVDKKTLEFEPSLSVFWSTKYWNTSGEKLPLYSGSDSVRVFSEFGFRSTYGINGNIEVGTYLPNDFSYIAVGTKIKTFDSKRTKLAVLAGSQIKVGNVVMLKNGHDYKNLDNISLGIAGSFNKGKKFSVDVNSQFSKYIKGETHTIMIIF